jgi:hypothetical protein
MGIMYNDCHGMADAKSGRVRRVRPCVDTVSGASDPLRLKKVPKHPMGPGWGGWAHAGGTNEEGKEQKGDRPKETVGRATSARAIPLA